MLVVGPGRAPIDIAWQARIHGLGGFISPKVASGRETPTANPACIAPNIDYNARGIPQLCGVCRDVPQKAFEPVNVSATLVVEARKRQKPYSIDPAQSQFRCDASIGGGTQLDSLSASYVTPLQLNMKRSRF